jgi:type II secretory pathway pseudopilin PulG
MGIVGVAATARVVNNRQEARREQEAASTQAAAEAAAEKVASENAAPSAPAADDLTAQLEKLAGLKTAGVISEAEFTAAKAKLLGI